VREQIPLGTRSCFGPMLLRCGFDFREICNPMRYHVHPRARPMKQAMGGLSVFEGLERQSRIRFPTALDAPATQLLGDRDIEDTGGR